MKNDKNTKYYTPTKAYGQKSIKRQWHCVILEVKDNHWIDSTLADQTCWIEDNIEGQWWSTPNFYWIDEGHGLQRRQPMMEFYFTKKEDATLFKFAWMW